MFNLNQIAYGIISIIGNNHNFAYCLQKRNPFWSKKTFCRNKKIKKAKKPTEKAIKEYIIKIVDYNYSFVKLQTVPASKKMIYGISVAIMTKSEKSSTHREK